MDTARRLVPKLPKATVATPNHDQMSHGQNSSELDPIGVTGDPSKVQAKLANPKTLSSSMVPIWANQDRETKEADHALQLRGLQLSLDTGCLKLALRPAVNAIRARGLPLPRDLKASVGLIKSSSRYSLEGACRVPSNM